MPMAILASAARAEDGRAPDLVELAGLQLPIFRHSSDRSTSGGRKEPAVADIEYWIQIENRAWDLRAEQHRPHDRPDHAAVGLPGTGREDVDLAGDRRGAQRTMFALLLEDALILRRYTEPGQLPTTEGESLGLERAGPDRQRNDGDDPDP